jgi:TRAP-type mannitol/chloroaromatic compound transport system permease large subunit
MVQSQPGAFVLAIAKGKITIASLYRTLLRASHGTCMIVMIFIGASIFGYLFTLTHVTRDRPPGLHERAL